MGAFTRIKDLCKTTTFLLKLVELTLGVACVALVAGQFLLPAGQYLLPSRIDKEQTIYATLFGFFMLEIVIVLGYLLDYPIHRIVVLVICTAAVVMYLVSGGLLIEVWSDSKQKQGKVLGAGIVALLNGLVYGMDVVLTLTKCGAGGTGTFGLP